MHTVKTAQAPTLILKVVSYSRQYKIDSAVFTSISMQKSQRSWWKERLSTLFCATRGVSHTYPNWHHSCQSTKTSDSGVYFWWKKIATESPKLQRFLLILTQNSEVFKSEHPWRSVLYLRGNSSLIPLRLTAVCSPKVQLEITKNTALTYLLQASVQIRQRERMWGKKYGLLNKSTPGLLLERLHGEGKVEKSLWLADHIVRVFTPHLIVIGQCTMHTEHFAQCSYVHVYPA